MMCKKSFLNHQSPRPRHYGDGPGITTSRKVSDPHDDGAWTALIILAVLVVGMILGVIIVAYGK